MSSQADRLGKMFLFRAVFIFPKTNKHGMELTDRGINHMNHAGCAADRLGKMNYFVQVVFAFPETNKRGMELTDRGINHMNHAGCTVDRLGK